MEGEVLQINCTPMLAATTSTECKMEFLLMMYQLFDECIHFIIILHVPGHELRTYKITGRMDEISIPTDMVMQRFERFISNVGWLWRNPRITKLNVSALGKSGRLGKFRYRVCPCHNDDVGVKRELVVIHLRIMFTSWLDKRLARDCSTEIVGIVSPHFANNVVTGARSQPSASHWWRIIIQCRRCALNLIDGFHAKFVGFVHIKC